MRILIALTYYRPHTSGLTIYVERLARALAKRGHKVTVLTSRYERSLPRSEIKDGVRIVRAPVLFRVSKGVIMPTFGFLAWKHVLDNEVIHLHLPQFDAAAVALRGRLLRRPTIITYHSDLLLSPSLFNRFVNQVVHVMNNLAAVIAHKIVAYTQDFADHSPYLRRFNRKVNVILPPVELPKTKREDIDHFAHLHNPDRRHPVIGMATRFAAEKGVEVLLDALPIVLERYPDALVLFAGQYQDVMGEDAYFRRLYPRIQAYQSQGRWKFLGVLDPAQMAAFYPNLSVLLVPSLNSTETFGLVQIEAMMNGVPTVASNLPGVRQPVQMTGMGEIMPIGDAASLGTAMLRIFDHPERYRGNPKEVRNIFNPQTNAAAYEKMYQELMEQLGK
jgi:glycosyltransferase involved in cell wall biosynthesis